MTQTQIDFNKEELASAERHLSNMNNLVQNAVTEHEDALAKHKSNGHYVVISRRGELRDAKHRQSIAQNTVSGIRRLLNN